MTELVVTHPEIAIKNMMNSVEMWIFYIALEMCVGPDNDYLLLLF